MPGPPNPIPVPTNGLGAPGAPSPTPNPGGGVPIPGIDWNGAEGAFTHWVQSAGQWLMPQLQLALGDGGTTPGADWFVNPIYEVMLGLGLAFAIPLTLISLIASVRQGSIAMVGRMAINLGMAIVISQFAIWTVVLLDNLADDVTVWSVQKLIGGNVTGLLTHLGAVFTGAAAGTIFTGAPELVGVLLGGAILLGAVILLVELFMRMVGIYLGLAFVPIAAVGLVNPATHGWIHKLAQIEIGLIMLKPALFLLLAIGAAMLSASPTSVDPQGASGLIAFAGGLVVILLAVFTPYYLMKFVPWAEAGIASAVSAKAQGVAGVPLRHGSQQLRTAAMNRFGSRIPGLRGASKALPAAGAAAATAGGTVVLRAANVVVRRAGDVPKLAGGTVAGPVRAQAVHAGPPSSVVRVVPPRPGNGTGTGKQIPKRQPAGVAPPKAPPVPKHEPKDQRP